MPGEVTARRSAAHGRNRWRLLPPGPDLVHGRPLHRTRPSPHPALAGWRAEQAIGPIARRECAGRPL